MTSTPTPKLELPQRTAVSNRRPRSGAMVLVLLVLVLAMQLWSMLAGPPSGGAGLGNPNGTAQAASTDKAEAERSLAMKLEDRNLPVAAIDAWGRYLTVAGLDGPAEGKIRYRVAKLKEQAEHYQEAVGEFYRAEQLLGDQAGDLSQKIAAHVRECLMKLGQFADLSREMADRADVSDDTASLEGRQVVAQIGDEKITVADFDRMLTEQIEQMIAMQVGISDSEAQEIRRQAHARFADPQAKTQQLQQLVASRVLAQEARRRGLQKSQAFRRQVADSEDRLLAARLMLDEIGRRATVTPQDIERYYQANKDRYTDPASVSIGHILCPSEDSARIVISKADGGEDFGELAQEFSLDKATKDKGGLIAQPVPGNGDFVPGIGPNAVLHTAIMAAGADTVLAVPYKSDKGWHVVKVVDRTERREKPFDEVRDQVERDVRAARRQEVSQQYLQELFKAKGVKFYPGAFTADEVHERTGG